ncbi:MAG TPA: 3-isopropylmalate dehydratase small subunit [Spirochaetia bacterium]|nr:3-isopropylmalate dehydratase small subunit [Spirochaetia bacterium]
MAEVSSIRKLIKGRGIVLPGDDIDTDRIIPARYLRMVTFEELGKYAFMDERFDENGKPKKHPLNDPRFKDGSILLVNRNFGCGSSREHAPQSLMRMGITAFVGESFAEIFSGNCTALGLPAARVSYEDAAKLQALVEASPSIELTMDLESLTISAGGRKFSFTMPDSDRKSLASGTWDTTTMLLSNKDAIRGAASRIPYLRGFAVAKGTARG